MARLNKKAELWSFLSDAGVFRDAVAGAAATTVASGGAAGATTVTVVSSTGFLDQDYIRFRSAETVEINQQFGAPAGNVITVKFNFAIACTAGDAVVRQVQTSIGHISDTGVKVDIKGDHNVVKSAVRRLALAYLIGHVEIEAEWDMIGYNLENFATSLGMLEGDITGAGTAGNPSRLFANPDLYDEQNDLSFYFQGSRKDGTLIFGMLWGCEVDFSAAQSQFQRGKEAMLPIRVRVTSGYSISYH